jgi:hypothetical protein
MLPSDDISDSANRLLFSGQIVFTNELTIPLVNYT